MLNPRHVIDNFFKLKSIKKEIPMETITCNTQAELAKAIAKHGELFCQHGGRKYRLFINQCGEFTATIVERGPNDIGVVVLSHALCTVLETDTFWTRAEWHENLREAPVLCWVSNTSESAQAQAVLIEGVLCGREKQYNDFFGTLWKYATPVEASSRYIWKE